jgi:CheY-like chemotaxis protein
MPHKLKLLIIEDEAPIREGLIGLFVYHGYDADGAADGEQGLQMALTGGYALIVLDIMLPRLDGFKSAARFARRMPKRWSARIEQRLQNILEAEQQRPFAQYSFFNVLESPLLLSEGVTFSPLFELPPENDVPGIVGYFQIDPDGSFHSPVLPSRDTVPLMQHRRKEKVRLPDQAAARALFDRPRRQVPVSAPPIVESAGVATEAEIDRAPGAIGKKSGFALTVSFWEGISPQLQLAAFSMSC